VRHLRHVDARQPQRPPEVVERAAVGAVVAHVEGGGLDAGLSRIIALYDRSSTLYQIRKRIRYLSF
jgi:hypothetical protein